MNPSFQSDTLHTNFMLSISGSQLQCLNWVFTKDTHSCIAAPHFLRTWDALTRKGLLVPAKTAPEIKVTRAGELVLELAREAGFEFKRHARCDDWKGGGKGWWDEFKQSTKSAKAVARGKA